jgi:Collagen triple helix repeat (20 copies)
MSEIELFAKNIVDNFKSYLADEIAPLVKRIAELEARELPQILEGKAGIDGDNGKDGADGKDGDAGDRGLGIKSAMINREGELVLVFENGETQNIGLVVGRDGVDGKDGRDGIDGANGKDGEKGLDGKDGEKGLDGKDGRDGIDGQKGIDGANGIDGKDGLNGVDGQKGIDGKDGADGLSIEDINLEFDGEKTFKFTFKRGDAERSFDFKAPVPVYRDVYEAEKQYQAGDVVTWAGSMWVAKSDTNEKPGTGSGWRLAVKSGRDGRNGKDGAKGERGIQGERGKDLTQMNFDGHKY